MYEILFYLIRAIIFEIREQNRIGELLDFALEFPPPFPTRKHAEWIGYLNEKYGV